MRMMNEAEGAYVAWVIFRDITAPFYHRHPHAYWVAVALGFALAVALSGWLTIALMDRWNGEAQQGN
jgi:hypothetical protein